MVARLSQDGVEDLGEIGKSGGADGDGRGGDVSAGSRG